MRVAPNRSSANRALPAEKFDKIEALRSLRPLLEDHADHCGNNLACLFHQDGVSDPDVLPLDFIRIVQGGTAHFRARDVFVRAEAPGHGEFEQVGWVFAGMRRDQPSPTVRDATITDTDALLGEAGYSREEIAALREEGVAA